MSYKKIIILGLSQVGKTTLIICALRNKIPAFDMHGDAAFISYVINLDISLFLDADEMSALSIQLAIDKSDESRDNVKTVLLLPPKDVYLKREHDAWAQVKFTHLKTRENLNQKGLEVPTIKRLSDNPNKSYDEFEAKKSSYDLVIEEVLSPQEILDYIIEKTGFKNVV
jgi:hypothetical protein